LRTEKTAHGTRRTLGQQKLGKRRKILLEREPATCREEGAPLELEKTWT